MLFSRFVRLFNHSRGSLPAELGELRSEDQLRNILNRERARADRSGLGFAVLYLVIFAVLLVTSPERRRAFLTVLVPRD